MLVDLQHLHKMIDYYLKFDSEAQAKSLLFPNASEENGLGFSPFGSVDLIGTLYDYINNEDSNPYDDDINQTSIPVAGYHVNVRAMSEFSELDAYRVYPVTPRRVWL